jgi:hypothetical protein
MRDVDSHRSRRVGQLPFLDGRSSVRALSLQSDAACSRDATREAAPNSAPAQLETYYGDAIRCAIACQA